MPAYTNNKSRDSGKKRVAMAEERLHVAVIPSSGSGHINPMLELSRRLLPLGFRVSFILPANSCSKVQLRDEDAGMIDLVPIAPSDKIMLLAPDLQEEVKPTIQALQPPVKCLISGWSQDMADSLGLAFVTTACATESIAYHMQEIFAKGFPVDPDDQDLVDFIPGFKPFPRGQLPLGFRRPGPTMPALGAACQRMKEAACVLVNTVEELEQEFVTLRRAHFSYYLPVGPLLPAAFLEDDSGSLDDITLTWLEKQPPSSVLYIAFGSLVSMAAHKVEKIAEAVKATRQPVLWAIRRNFASDAPENFIESLQVALGTQGLVVEWAPQARVLKHSSVGAFFTHCGWNSTIEAAHSGVPMLCWPCDNDQNVNARTITEKWKIGMMVADGSQDDVKCEDLAKVIDAILNGEEGREMRSRAQALKKTIREGVCQNKNLRQLKEIVASL